MSYKAKHAARAWVGRTILTATLAVLGGGTYALTANAVPVSAQINNTSIGEAGYYANDNGQTRFRDVQATTKVLNTFKFLNGTESPGGIGVELCNDNTNYAAQLGIQWTGTQFQLAYNYGTLVDPTPGIQDPCAQDGLLNGGVGIQFPHPIVPNVGDVLKFEIFYQPKGFIHYFQFKVTDVTQNRTEVQKVLTAPHDLYEFGIGVLTNDAHLTAPANILLNSFTSTSANYYSSTKAWNSINVPSHWDLEYAQLINSSSQVTLSPNNSLNPQGTAFNLYEGSTSA